MTFSPLKINGGKCVSRCLRVVNTQTYFSELNNVFQISIVDMDSWSSGLGRLLRALLAGARVRIPVPPNFFLIGKQLSKVWLYDHLFLFHKLVLPALLSGGRCRHSDQSLTQLTLGIRELQALATLSRCDPPTGCLTYISHSQNTLHCPAQLTLDPIGQRQLRQYICICLTVQA